MKYELTKNEALFIHHAAWIIDGVLDFDNDSPGKFKKDYGFTKKQAFELQTTLREKFKKSEILKNYKK